MSNNYEQKDRFKYKVKKKKSEICAIRYYFRLQADIKIKTLTKLSHKIVSDKIVMKQFSFIWDVFSKIR